MHANKQSVAELLLGFFRYYTETFQWSEDVVNIRNSAELRKADKGWLQKPMAVEGLCALDKSFYFADTAPYL